MRFKQRRRTVEEDRRPARLEKRTKQWPSLPRSHEPDGHQMLGQWKSFSHIRVQTMDQGFFPDPVFRLMLSRRDSNDPLKEATPSRESWA